MLLPWPFSQALRLSRGALGQSTSGQMVNLLSNDVNRMDVAVIFIHYLWIGPLQTAIVTYLTWDVFVIKLRARARNQKGQKWHG